MNGPTCGSLFSGAGLVLLWYSCWMPRGAKPKKYDAALVERVADLYGQGMTQLEVAERAGVSRKVVWNLMRRSGIRARAARARQPLRGPEHGQWRGDDAGYQALHLRVVAQRGQPLRCQRCGTTDPGVTYDWANLTGAYADPDDYERMCRKCHRTFDGMARDAAGRFVGGDA